MQSFVGAAVASLTVRDIDEDVKRRFVEKARREGLSTEAFHRRLVVEAATAKEAVSPNGERLIDEARKPLLALDLSAEEWAELEEHLEAPTPWRATDQFR